MRTVQRQMMWSTRAQWVFTVALLALLVAFFVGAWRPAQGRLSFLKAQIDEHHRKLETNRSREEIRSRLKNNVRELELELAKFDKRLPKSVELGEFIRDLTQLSQQYGLKKLVHQPGQIGRYELHGEIPITMHFEGDFINVFNFLRQMEEMQRLARVKTFQVKCKDPKLGQVDVNLAMTIYFSEL